MENLGEEGVSQKSNYIIAKNIVKRKTKQKKNGKVHSQCVGGEGL